jgi:hypothetical protein
MRPLFLLSGQAFLRWSTHRRSMRTLLVGLILLAMAGGTTGSPAVAQVTSGSATLPSTVSSDGALVGWAAGPGVSAELDA